MKTVEVRVLFAMEENFYWSQVVKIFCNNYGYKALEGWKIVLQRVQHWWRESKMWKKIFVDQLPIHHHIILYYIIACGIFHYNYYNLLFYSTDLDTYNDAIQLLSHCPVAFPASWRSCTSV